MRRMTLSRFSGTLLGTILPIASNVIHTITDGIDKLKVFSSLGRSGQVEGTREMVFTSLPYIAVYRVKENAVEILRVYHAAQDWP